jgi:addiction module HigA family antidote
MMTANCRRPIHPGKIMREAFLRRLNLSPIALSKVLRVPPSLMMKIVREESAVTAEIALRLAQYFGTTPEFWLMLQMKYDLAIAAENAMPVITRDPPLREDTAMTPYDFEWGAAPL